MSNSYPPPAPSPYALQNAIKNLAVHVVKYQFSNHKIQVVGLGSGSTVAAIVEEMAKLPVKGGTDRPVRLRAKNIAPNTRGIGKPTKRGGVPRVYRVPRSN